MHFYLIHIRTPASKSQITKNNLLKHVLIQAFCVVQ